MVGRELWDIPERLWKVILSFRGHVLRPRDLTGAHQLSNGCSFLDCVWIAMCGCQIVPHMSTDQIPGNTLSVEVHRSHIDLGSVVAASSGA
jgi:hypothetical protein